jgi:mRNA-degrading endonuclease RelE of RelBE toxin-antitoxin system
VPYTVVFWSEVITEGDISLVQKSKLRAAVDDLARNPEVGKPLVGPLMGCRRIRVGGSENRLVYRILEEQSKVEVIAIGRRRDDQVYKTATKRMT